MKNRFSNQQIILSRCVLNALKRTPQPQTQTPNLQSEIIDLSDDDEDGDIEMVAAEAKNDKWHSSVMRILETRYAEAFDAVKIDILSNQDEESSSLRIVLGKQFLFDSEENYYFRAVKNVYLHQIIRSFSLTIFVLTPFNFSGALLCSTYNADPSGAPIFVDLHHPSAKNRMNAVESLVNMNKLSTMPFSDDKKNLLVAGIAQRFVDDSPDVVNEVLKFKTEDLVKFIGEQNLIKKLKFIIGDQFVIQKQWQNPIRSAIKHIASKHLVSNDNEIEVFLALWPYMFPIHENSYQHAKAITKSCIASRFPIIKELQDLTINNNPMECVNKRLENSFEKSKFNEIVQFVKTIPDAEVTTMLAFHIINLLTHSLPKNSDHKLSNEVFDILTKLSVQFEWTHNDIEQYAHDLYSKSQPGKLPIQLRMQCIQSIIEKTNFSAVFNSNGIDFTVGSDAMILMLNLYKNLCNGLFSNSKRTINSYNRAMSQFIRNILPNIGKQLDFFSNFFIAHYIDQIELPSSLLIDPQLQIRSIRLFNDLLTRPASLNEISMEVFVRIFSGLSSPFEAVRELTCDTIDKMFGLLDKSSQYSKLLGLALSKRGKFSMSPDELSSFLFETKHKRKELFQFIQRPDTSMILKATLLDMLQFVNDDKHEMEYLNIVVGVAWDILNEIDCSQPAILNPHESIVVYQAIIRFNNDNLSSIWTTGKCRNFFATVLQQSNVYLQIDGKLQSISVEAMKLNIFTNFKKFPIGQKQFIINSVIKAATFSKANDVRSKASKFFKKSIELDGKIELDILSEMANVTSTDASKKDQVKCLSHELLQTPEWKCGITLLEFLHKKRLENPLDLIRQLFPVLKKCLDFIDQSMVEYTKQLVLNDILNCCELMPSTVPFLENELNVELVIHCVQLTNNPQTHHHALQLLARLAKMVPDRVLENITQIFTFIGSTVASRDDDYIYQLISKIIESVVPILQQNNIIQVLEVFSGEIVFDTPIHRRSALYEDLLKTLNQKKSLWMFLAILLKGELLPDV